MPAARGASGVQLVGVCWYRGCYRRDHVTHDCTGKAESAQAEHKRGVAVARVDIIMPQMGESIAEGTLSKWLKKVGDEVKRDEPIFEISTDKVDAEIPAPAAGVLAEIIVKEGETVAVQTVEARLEAEEGAVAGGGGGGAGGAPAPGAGGGAAGDGEGGGGGRREAGGGWRYCRGGGSGEPCCAGVGPPTGSYSDWLAEPSAAGRSRHRCDALGKWQFVRGSCSHEVLTAGA